MDWMELAWAAEVVHKLFTSCSKVVLHLSWLPFPSHSFPVRLVHSQADGLLRIAEGNQAPVRPAAGQ